MARGRKGQAAETKFAKGNPGKRDVKTASATDLPHIGIATPAKLTREGKKVWQDLVPKLVHSKLLRVTDQEVLTRYCDMVAQYWKATRQVRKMGEVYEATMTHGQGKMMRINPWFAIQSRLVDKLQNMEDRLGLSPRSRQELMFRLAQVPATPPGELFKDGDESLPAPDATPGRAVGFLNGPVAGNA